MATFVLVPGAGGQAWYWQRVGPLIEAAGHEAIAVDLPAADDNAGLAAYRDVVVDAIGLREDVILVAQSLAGFSAPLVCQRASVAQLVLVNAMIPAPGESAGDWGANTGSSGAAADKARAEGRDPDADFDPFEIFFHDVPEDAIAEVQKMPEPAQSDRPFADAWPLDRWPDVETHVVISADDRLFPADFQRRVARERLAMTLDVIPGGHLPAQGCPDELAELLLSYVH